MAAEMDAGVSARDEYEEQVRFFQRFLMSDADKWESQIKTMLVKNERRMFLNLADIERAQPQISNDILQNPVKFIPAFEEALFAFVRQLDEKAANQMKRSLKIGFEGAFGRQHVTPRGLTSSMLGPLVCVEGVVTKS